MGFASPSPMMHIDPFTIVIFTVIISLLMSAGLYMASRSYLMEVKGIRCWTKALLLMGIGWLLLALYGIIPNFFSLVIGTILSLLSLVFYFHAVMAFKELNVSMRWLYLLVALVFIGHIYFVHISSNMVARIVVTSLSIAVLLLANSFLLLTKQHGICPRSHRLTAAFFIFTSCVYVIRAIYYLVWNTQPEQVFFQHNIIQDIAYLTNATFIIGSSFGFALMCNEKYIAEKNRGQLNLKESVALLNTIIESTADSLLIVDLTGTISKYNSVFVKMWAIPEPILNTMSEKLLLDFVSSQLVNKESFIPDVINAYKHLHDDTFSELYIKDGRVIESYSRPQYLNDEPIGRVWSFRDITKRKKSETRLSTLSLALEQSQSAVIITDLETNIEYVNEAFVRSSGYDKKDIIGKKPSMFSSRKTPKVVYQTMWETLMKNETWQGEITNKNKRGEEFIELTWISPIRQVDGTVTHYLGVKEDITERKRIETDLLEAKEQAELLAMAKSQFLTNMSHEIRTPMSAIIGFSQLALNKKFDPEVLDYLTKINRASVSLLGILNGIMDLSKLEAGHMILECQPFYIESLRDNLCSLFNLAAQQKMLDFDIDIAADVPLQLIGDELRLQQILINLLGNAIKFTERGAVTLKITLQQIDASEARLLFCVTDTGIGLSLEDQSRLFKPFSQVDESNHRRFMGTGLGLAISKDLLKLMDSYFSLVSTPKLGSSFSFELVLGVPSISLQNSAPQKSEALSSVSVQTESMLMGKRILVVEDNDLNQQIIREYLKQSGITVKIANNGVEALMILEQDECDGVLMDIHMPVMDGYETTKRIRAQPRFTHLPIIALTAGVTQEERGQCMVVGMNDFINKPFNPALLLSTLVHWLKPDGLVDDENTPQDVKQCLDANVLKALIGDDPATVAEFLGYFHVSAIALSTEIIVALNTGQVAVVIAATHKLSSSAGSVGAITLGNLCTELESAGKANDQARLNMLLPRFEREWHSVDKLLNSGMGVK